MLIALGMHTKVMYCFSCYLALKLKTYLQYSIDITTEQSFRYMEFVDCKNLDFQKCVIMSGFANRVTYVSGVTGNLYQMAITCSHTLIFLLAPS